MRNILDNKVDTDMFVIVWIVQGAKIQLLDLPGIIEGAKDGKGRGRQVQTRDELILLGKTKL